MNCGRRPFLRSLALGASSIPLVGMASSLGQPGTTVSTQTRMEAALAACARVKARFSEIAGDPETLAAADSVWSEVRQCWVLDRSLVNLENGGLQPSPASVLDAYTKANAFGHEAPVLNIHKIQEPKLAAVRERLALSFGCQPDELALMRNTTEGIQNIALGYPLRAGEEVITTTQDYWRFLNAFKQRREREGIELRTIRIPVPVEDEGRIVELFEQAITARTRVILISHVINLTGQVLPVRALVQMARKHGVFVIVDGAHGFAQFPFRRDELDCDVYATSLHKWLNAPHGTGFLYVRKELIPRIWPLFPAPEEVRDTVRKFESIGTVPAAPFLGIADALDFWQAIGPERKAARLRWLRERWLKPIESERRSFVVHSSRTAAMSSTLATVELKGVSSDSLAKWLWEKHRTLVRPIQHQEYQGIRVTPSLFTSPEDLDGFVRRLLEAPRRLV